MFVKKIDNLFSGKGEYRVRMRLKLKIISAYGSQKNFAAAAGVDESLVSRIVKGERDPTAEQRTTWSKLLGVESSNYLFRHEENGHE